MGPGDLNKALAALQASESGQSPCTPDGASPTAPSRPPAAAAAAGAAGSESGGRDLTPPPPPPPCPARRPSSPQPHLPPMRLSGDDSRSPAAAACRAGLWAWPKTDPRPDGAGPVSSHPTHPWQGSGRPGPVGWLPPMRPGPGPAQPAPEAEACDAARWEFWHGGPIAGLAAACGAAASGGGGGGAPRAHCQPQAGSLADAALAAGAGSAAAGGAPVHQRWFPDTVPESRRRPPSRWPYGPADGGGGGVRDLAAAFSGARDYVGGSSAPPPAAPRTFSSAGFGGPSDGGADGLTSLEPPDIWALAPGGSLQALLATVACAARRPGAAGQTQAPDARAAPQPAGHGPFTLPWAAATAPQGLGLLPLPRGQRFPPPQRSDRAALRLAPPGRAAGTTVRDRRHVCDGGEEAGAGLSAQHAEGRACGEEGARGDAAWAEALAAAAIAAVAAGSGARPHGGSADGAWQAGGARGPGPSSHGWRP